jgi:hypothetical protein
MADLQAICSGLPEVELGTSWGDRPTYLVSEEYQDLLVIRTANAEDKAALVEGDGPFFTIDHFRNFNAVLLQQSRIGEVDVDELREVLTDAWLAVAPKSLAKKFLAGDL